MKEDVREKPKKIIEPILSKCPICHKEEATKTELICPKCKNNKVETIATEVACFCPKCQSYFDVTMGLTMDNDNK